MKTTAFISFCFALSISGHLHAQTPAPAPAEVSSIATAGFEHLTLSAISDNEDVWPAKVSIVETIDFSGGLTINKGEELAFLGFHENGEAHLDYHGEYTFTLPFEYTDFLRRANDIASGKAKANGYQGRLVEQLDRKVYIQDGGNLRTASADEIAGAELYLFYHSSQACRWSGRFTPDLVETVNRLRAQYPGKMEVIYVSSDRNMQELQGHLKTVGARAVMPPRPDWYIDTFSQLHPTVRQINQPSFMLMNANGRLIDSGMRRDNDYGDMFAGLEALPERLANDALYVPAWMRLSQVPAAASTATATAGANSAAAEATAEPALAVPTYDSGEVVQNTDSSIVGPIPYTTTLRDGTEVPGLVMHDTRTSGSRIPALTLQAFPPHDGEPGYYQLSFRQVLGKTYGSKPLLAGWITSVTRPGPDADADLLTLVGHYKELHARFQDWRQTAISNDVSNFEKEMYVMPMTYFDTRVVRRDTSDTDLELFFKVFDDPNKATFKGDRWSLTYGELDAFERLIPQIDALVTQMPAEIVRTAEARVQREADAERTDALFE